MSASSPGPDGNLLQACDEEADITYLTVGFWRRSDKPAPLSFLVLHSSEKFVLLSEEPWRGQQAQSKRLFKLVKQLNTKSPFKTSSCSAGPYTVVAFEIRWEDVCGFNYHNPLCMDGRVVIEAAKLTKRQFLTVKEARKFYLKLAASPEAGSPAFSKHVRSRALRTYASSPNMTLPLVSRQSHATSTNQTEEALHQHVHWQANQSQQSFACSAQPAAMRSLESALPSMPETAAVKSALPSMPEAAEAVPSMLEAAAASQEPAALEKEAAPHLSGTLAAAHAHQLDGTRGKHHSCLKHAGVGTLSPPQARHTHSPDSTKPAADHATQRLSTDRPAGNSLEKHHHSSDALKLSTDKPANNTQKDFHPHGSQQSTEVQPAIDSTVKSAFSGVSLLPEDQTRRLSDSSEQGMPAQWPEVCTWTLPCHVYNYRTVTFNFRDPALPGVLQPAINNNERLLKLYESGLPVWAIFLPTYGMYYRPWMRRVTWILFIAVSIFSMACGFYDLYKNVPHVDMVLRKVLGSVFLPSTAIFHWLENHAQIRLSILLTYLFGESILFVHLLTWLDRAWNVAGRPIANMLGPHLVVLGSGLEQWGTQMLQLGRSLATALSLAGKAVMGPPLQFMLAVMQALGQLMLPVWQVLVMVVTGPLALTWNAAESVRSASSTLWQGLKPIGKVAKSASGLVRTTSLAATSSGASMADMTQQVGWWTRVPWEAWELMRISSLKTIRAVQTLAKLATQFASETLKHRDSLGRRFCRTWRRCKRWFWRLLRAICSVPMAAYFWLASCRPLSRNATDHAHAGTVTHVRADATDRPIMTGMMPSESHTKPD